MTVSEMPALDRPISEEYRLAAKEWVEAERIAHLLEETKSANKSQMMMKHAELAISRAEMMVLASDEWKDFVTRMVDARRHANFAKVRMKYVEMRFSEWQASDANQRNERRMSR